MAGLPQRMIPGESAGGKVVLTDGPGTVGPGAEVCFPYQPLPRVSPPAGVQAAHQTSLLMEALTWRTLPSPSKVRMPLDRGAWARAGSQAGPAQGRGATWNLDWGPMALGYVPK